MSHLIDEMAKDMNIYPYQSENKNQYKCRVIYSAIAQWIRYNTLDYPDVEIIGKRKAYILQRAKDELTAFIDSFPEVREWFLQDADTLDDVVRDLRTKMLGAGELVEICSGERVSLPPYSRNICCNGIVQVQGLREEKISFEHVGITRIYVDGTCEYQFGKGFAIEDFFKWVYKNAKWSECTNIDNYEMFDAYSTKPPYQSWSEKKNKSIKYHLGRLTLYNGLHEYWLIKYEDGIWYVAPFSEVLASHKEERRILFALRKMNKNSIEASYKHCGSAVILNLYCKLPTVDENYINTFAWPLRYALDKLDYVVPFKIWNQLKYKLEIELGLVLREKL